MPLSPPRVCATCNRIGCAGHATPRVWTNRNRPPRRTGRWLQGARARLFEESPLCVHCKRNGLITPATQRDHIVPLGDDGPDLESNTQALCEDCHRAKTIAELKRGIVR